MTVNLPSSPYPVKRSRDDEEAPSSAKRSKAPGGGAIDTSREMDARDEDEAMMECDDEDDAMGGHSGNGGPQPHDMDMASDWSTAPRMHHQLSISSLSSLSSSISNGPSTPTDFPASFAPADQTPHQSTMFTDMAGVTRVFPSDPQSQQQQQPQLGLYPQQEGTIQVRDKNGGLDGFESVRTLVIPVYGWDVPKQGMCMGGHLV
ncbi:hypothetical protein RQP46_003581 [Phenoliferia psychrophenolica]